jgi:transposase InsO family protein
MDEARRQKIALERYGAIHRLVEADALSRQARRGLARELASASGHAPQTLWRWAQRFRAGGYHLEALLPPAHRRDRGKLVAFPAAVLAEAVRLREEEPQRSTTTLIELIRRLHPDWDVQILRPTLDRHLRVLGKTRRRLARPNRPLRRFQKSARNALWIADFCFPKLSWRDGQEIRGAIVLAFLDHHSRKVVAGGFVASRQAVVVEEMLKQAIATHGLPAALFVDNGAELVGSLIKSGCMHLGIQHVRADVGEPEGRGAIERFYRTFQDAFVPEMAAKAMIPTLDELNRFWQAWLEEFYHARPHSALGGLSPRQAWEQDRTPLTRVDPLTLDGALLVRQSRRVDKTALVSWDGRKYLCEDALVGDRVEIRFLTQVAPSRSRSGRTATSCSSPASTCRPRTCRINPPVRHGRPHSRACSMNSTANIKPTCNVSSTVGQRPPCRKWSCPSPRHPPPPCWPLPWAKTCRDANWTGWPKAGGQVAAGTAS